FWSPVKAKTINGEVHLHALVDGKKIMITESTVRRDLQLEDAEGVIVPQPSDPSENVANEVVHKELGDSLVRAATTASSLEAAGQCDKDRLKLEELMALGALNGEEVFVAGQNENVVEEVVDVAQVSTAATTETITTEELTLAQALEALKTSKPKVKGIVFQEPAYEEKVQIMLDEEVALKLQAEFDEEERLARGKLKKEKRRQILPLIEQWEQLLEKRKKHFAAKRGGRLDEETALNLQAEFDEEERLAREKAKKEEEANIALIETWDDIQAKIDVDHQLAKRMQAQEQERAFKRVNTFEDFRTELVEGKEKRAGTELVQEITKKQKVEDDKETTELKQLMEIIPDEEVAINAIPLAIKSKSIVG
ncbi:hypothetical protein Tco_1568106, partial [Tanacetum coccineum]